MIPRRENLFARNIDQPRQFGERGTFVVIGMTETQIDCVALIIKFGLSGSHPLDEFRDAIHFFLARCSQTFGRSAEVDHACFRFSVYEIDDLGENGLGGIEQLRMSLRTTIVPITEWLPLAAIARWAEDIAFAGEDEIGPNGKFEIEQT